MTTSLITGRAGFLGSHLCEELLAHDHRVICVDNLETGSLANIEHLRSEAFSFVHADIIEPFFVAEPADVVHHFASPASPIDYLRLPLHTLKVGSYGTHHALGLAKLHRARFLLASTSEVYGDPPVHPQPESYWGHVNRTRDPDVLAPGATEPADHGVRRRLPDAVVLLRERPRALSRGSRSAYSLIWNVRPPRAHDRFRHLSGRGTRLLRREGVAQIQAVVRMRLPPFSPTS